MDLRPKNVSEAMRPGPGESPLTTIWFPFIIASTDALEVYVTSQDF
jgi:hypothetical protein